MEWTDSTSELGQRIISKVAKTNREVYRFAPPRIISDFRIVSLISQGDYRERQIFELVQNGADAIGFIKSDSNLSGRIKIVLTRNGLYCANEGLPFTFEGIEAIALPVMSAKSGNEIGRYGQGFKSVLAVTNEPRIYSRSVSCHYSFQLATEFLLEEIDEEKSNESSIKHQQLGSKDDPKVSILAIPVPVDPDEFFAMDPILKELSEWAATIIHLPFTDSRQFIGIDRFKLLQSALDDFPSEFLIFAGNVKKLDFEVHDQHIKPRTISCDYADPVHFHSQDGIQFKKIKVDEGGGKTREWLVVDKQNVVIPSSVGSVGNQLETNRRRDEKGDLLPVPISWAVPLSGQLTRGTFWLFFPTKDGSTMRGIINAPWDTNNERTQVLATGYNQFLLKEFADLFVKSIPVLVSLFPDDKGKYLDYFPGRGYEEPSRASSLLVDQVTKSMCENNSLIDLDGQLQKPSTMRQIPGVLDGVDSNLHKQWAQIEGTARNLPHWTLIDAGGNRIAGYNRYLEKSDHPAANKPGDLVSWLEGALNHPTLDNSAESINLVRSLLAHVNFEVGKRAKEAKIILCAGGKLAAPIPGVLFYSDRGVVNSEILVVHQDLMNKQFIREFLIDECLITEAEGAAELDVVLAKWPENPADKDWKEFWAAAEKLGAKEFMDVKSRHARVNLVKAQSVSEKFCDVAELFLPGKIFKSGEGDDELIIDVAFHAKSLEILKNLGLSEYPPAAGAVSDYPDIAGYKGYLKRNLPADKQTAAHLKRAYESAPPSPAKFGLLSRMKEFGRARYTTWVFENFHNTFSWKPDNMSGLIDSPTLWYIKQFGLIETSLGPREFGEALSQSMASFKRVAPVSQVLAELTNGCGLRTSFAELSMEALGEIIERLSTEVDDQLIGDCLGAICRYLPAPKLIPCKVRRAIELHGSTSVTVVADRDEFDRISAVGIPVVLAANPEMANELATRWGLKAGESVQQDFEPGSPSEPELLSDMFFLLGERYPRKISEVYVVRCTSLINVIQTPEGQARNNVPSAYHDKTIYVVANSLDSSDKVLRAADKFLHLNLGQDEFTSILEYVVSQAVESKRQAIRGAVNEIDKITTIFSIEQMKAALPVKILEEIAAEADSPVILAEMLQAVYGPQLLEKTKFVLQELGLQPPGQWAGSKSAIKFVTELGFDRPFAGFKEPDRAAHTEVQGKIELGDLHPYQVQLKNDIKSFVAREENEPKWRATLYLPTGAGKTRVTVQGILELINEGKLGNRPVLWIAQSYEICEQAVQAFTEVWSSIGTVGSLSVDRFWNEKSVEEVSIPSEYAGQIVVAVDAKLVSSAVQKQEYEWLKNAALVVVDEAHRGATKSYTKILSWLGTGVRLSKNVVDDRPILGLTATPAHPGIEARFGPRMIRIDEDVIGDSQSTDVEYLRGIGVLSYATHELLPGVLVGEPLDDQLEGESEDDDAIDGDDSESSNPKSTKRRQPIWLPQAVEERLAENRERNGRIIESILSLDSTWPVIVFALSVSHAQLLAALLAKNGVKSASVSGETSPSIRKLHISNFRSGKIRVLTNYGVLTTGFDAPKVQAIYITRPTFSKGLYLQMIGRGLRGPVNGGTRDCLIVDIEDNFENMNIDHIYKEMGDWWLPSGSGAGFNRADR